MLHCAAYNGQHILGNYIISDNRAELNIMDKVSISKYGHQDTCALKYDKTINM